MRNPKFREKWPVTGSKDPADEEEQNEYGIAGLLNEEEHGMPETTDEDIPESEIEEVMEVADIPLHEEPQQGMFPPGSGIEPGPDCPQDDMPETPPDIFGEPMP